jgi:TolB-like protein
LWNGDVSIAVMPAKNWNDVEHDRFASSIFEDVIDDNDAHGIPQDNLEVKP